MAFTQLARRGAAIAAVATLSLTGLSALDAHAATGTVNTTGSTLTLRSTASTGGAALVSIPNGTQLTLVCKQGGESVSGSAGTTNVWDRVSYGGKTGYVSAAWVNGGTTSSIPLCGYGTVRTSGSTLTLRSSASTSGAVVGSIPDGTQVKIQCKVAGQSVSGTQGTTSTWVRISHGGATGYASAAYVWGGTNSFLGTCGSTPAPPTPGPTAQWTSPVPSSAPVTSRFGKRTLNGQTRMHNGTDFGYRGEVKSACTGTVERVYINPSYPNGNSYPTSGTTNMLTIKCDGGDVKMKYGHFYARELSSAVKVGARVKAGQYLHPVGNQGYSTGYHLHWEVWNNGSAVDGLAFLRNKGVTGLPR